MTDVVVECPECAGRTVEFKGSGLDTQYKICSRYREPGHLSATEINARVRSLVVAVRPSGRFA